MAEPRYVTVPRAGDYRGGQQIARVTPLTQGEVNRAQQQGYGAGMLLDASGRPIDPAVWRAAQDFGPGRPLEPRVTDPRQPPRVWQYPIATNTNVTPRGDDSGPSFTVLRYLAGACDYIRIAIRIRKDQVRAMPFDFFDPDADTQEKRDAHADRKAKLKEFWSHPNRLGGLDWPTWLGQVVEEVYVTDALAIWPVPRFDGEPHSLLQIDGATLKPIIDGMGNTVAVQQIIRGYPVSQYDVGTQVIPWQYGPQRPYLLEPTLYMKQYDARVDSAYGTSVVEELLPTIQTLIKKALTELAWYTEGNIPTMILQAPENCTPEQILDLQVFFDDMLSGDESQRHKMRVVPHGSNPVQAKPFEFSMLHEDALLSKVCALMGIPRYLFTSDVNKSTAESTDTASTDHGLRALQVYIAGLVNDLNYWLFGETVLKFQFTREPGAAQAKADEARVKEVQSGILTIDEARSQKGMLPKPVTSGVDPGIIQRAFLEAGFIRVNEMRATLGFPPIDGPAGEAFVAIGAYGVQDADSIEETAAKPKLAPAEGQRATAGGKPQKPAAEAVSEEPRNEAEKELAAWLRWAKKRDPNGSGRNFEFREVGMHISSAVASARDLGVPLHDIYTAALQKVRENRAGGNP